MKFLSFAAGFLLLLLSAAHGVDKEKYFPIAKGMMQFPDRPTEAGFREIESRMAKLSPLNYDSDDDQHVITISAAFLAGAHARHHWKLKGNGEIASAATDLIDGKGDVSKWARDDKAVGADKLDFWWMTYLGSQDEAYLRKILKYAGDPTPYKDERAIWVSLASWSFKANCTQIKGVREFAKRCLEDSAYKDRQEFLRSCLK